MLYHLLYPLSADIQFFNIFRYITTRSFIAFLIAVMAALYLGKKFINYMRRRQFGQEIRQEGPQSHLAKSGTPTMGGIFIIGSGLIALLVGGNFYSRPLWAVIFLLLSYFILGFVDDYLKILKKNSDGISARGKLAWQFLSAFLVVFYLVKTGILTTELYVPFVKDPILNLGLFYYLFASIVIVGSSNAVNLTDGLDGLAIVPIMTSLATLAIFCYISGHIELSQYLLLPYIPQLGELTVFSLAIMGAGIGFLWYNAYPAQVFMGDVGALSLGGLIGLMSVLSRNEILSIVFGGIFVMEALSVILQVASYKTRKKRIFRMAPLHHHFELGGWAEPKVIVRFWIVSLLLAIISVATIKLR